MSWPGPNAIVLHQDDVGMCHGANVAYAELTEFGTCSSGSVMVPCPWFSEAAEIAQRVPGADMGVHLTLTSEKEHYRWRPLTTCSKASGLVDGDGYMWRDVPSLRRHADPGAVEVELRAQIDAAYDHGIEVTHLDGHMGAVLAPEFCAIYLDLARTYRLPLLLTPELHRYDPIGNLGELGNAAPYREVVNAARDEGFVIVDHVIETVWSKLDDIGATYRHKIENVDGALVFAALHFNTPGDIEIIDPPVGAHVRMAEYDLFRSTQFRDWLSQIDREVIGMRPLRDIVRREAEESPVGATAS